MNDNRRRLWTYVAIAVGVSVVAIVVISLLTMDRNTFKAISRIDVLSFLVVLGLVFGKWASECLRYSLIVKAVGRRIPFRNTAKTVMGSAFTGSVTPMRSATYPVQIFFFTRYGLTGGEATAVSTTGGALTILVTIIALPIVLVLSASKIHVNVGIRVVIFSAALIGFFLFMFIVYSMRDPSKVARLVARLTPGFIRRKPSFERFQERLTRGMGDFSASLRRLMKAPKGQLALIVLLTVVFWFSGVFTASWILRGLGLGRYFWQALLGQVLVSSILPFTPTPGESGVAEAAFAGIFSIFIAKNTIALVTVSWRFFTLYLPLVALGIAFILATRDAARLGREQKAPREPQVVGPATVWTGGPSALEEV
jgi:uncharacterized protein (TIRG00374 family)